ncbi:MAG: helix-turn-helix domain-containing protein [Candidatus Thiodiazotropha weberae]|nr:helix-turn-helix domain-containing protein [Candidatus Thiodiazotropha lotti]MCG8010733.1 helix-turn-helix domain-containing protein [Candidatus Thiodiazotropha lotti]MCG8019454.1 helix-turn-helix domain-containing protein [Candidatus Thiodiazotropha lotti]MCW4206616.1 helix-turn-helix domain-containing protein [Candidatus Thiodiazotropha lotti]MCW4210192.1 helix-turn-helix domain-containing protein [Candidatus Thiodiazotropha lotti]
MSPLDRLRWLDAIVAFDGFRGGATIRTAIVLAEHCNKKTSMARPSIQTIAEITGLTQRAVRTALSDLQKANFLTIIRSSGGAPSSTNAYCLIKKRRVKPASGVNSALGVNYSSVSPELQFHEPLNYGSPEQGTEQGKDKISASGDAVAVNDEVEKFYITKRKRKLKCQQLERFNEFWETFELKRGKPEAADAWLDAKVTEDLFPTIITAARHEALIRRKQGENGPAPKWAQGWLSGRRWEDGDPEAMITVDELEAVVSAYHEIMSDSLRVIDSRGSLAANIEACILSDQHARKPGFWPWIFSAVNSKPEWRGRDLGWIISNFEKVRSFAIQLQGRAQ